MLRQLIAHSTWPAHETTGITRTEWIFWYKTIDFFINVSTANHHKRLSHNLGFPYTLIVQSRAVFDEFRSSKMKNFIRNNVTNYDRIGLSPAIGSHGDQTEVEQFFLGDHNNGPYVPLTTQEIKDLS